jgi:hypothetical protein
MMMQTVRQQVSESRISISAVQSPIVYRKTLRKEERHRAHSTSTVYIHVFFSILLALALGLIVTRTKSMID